MNDKIEMDYNIAKIVDVVCNYFGEEPIDVLIKGRVRNFVDIRRIIFTLCEKYTKFNYEKISRELSKAGHKYDRVTVYFHIKKLPELMDYDRKLRQNYHAIDNMLSNMINKEDYFMETKKIITNRVEKAKNIEELMNAFVL